MEDEKAERKKQKLKEERVSPPKKEPDSIRLKVQKSTNGKNRVL